MRQSIKEIQWCISSHPEAVFQFVANVLERQDILEHSSNVFDSTLTTKGDEVLDFLSDKDFDDIEKSDIFNKDLMQCPCGRPEDVIEFCEYFLSKLND